MIHESAIVEEGVILGKGVNVWHFAHVRTGAELGDYVSIGKDSYVDAKVKVGRGTRIQNQVSVFSGVSIKEWVFVGPSVVFTNDLFPRVGNKTWKVVETIVSDGVAIGAGAVIRCGITIGPFAMIGAGALVTKDVPAFTLVLGHPAEGYKHVCACGQTVKDFGDPSYAPILQCCYSNMKDEVLEVAKSHIHEALLRK